jgi:hypothetical protein
MERGESLGSFQSLNPSAPRLFSSLEASEILVGGEWCKEIGVPSALKRLDRTRDEILVSGRCRAISNEG